MPNIITQAIVDKTRFTGKRKLIADGGCKGLYLDIREKGKSFRYRYVDHDKIYRSITLGDAEILRLSDARAMVFELRRKRLLGSHLGSIKPIEAPIFKEFVINKYIPHAKSIRRAAHQDWTLFKNHLFPAFGDKRLNEIKRSDIGTFMQQKLAQNYSPATCNRLLARIKAVLSYATDIEVPGFDKNPAHRFKQLKEPVYLERYLSPDEAERLLEALRASESPLLQFIIPFLLLTGARKGEALKARWEYIDLTTGSWIIPMTKSGKPRHVPLSRGAIDILLAVKQRVYSDIGECTWVFPKLITGRPYTALFHSWDKARKSVGLGDVRIHDLRHSFASALVNRGMTLYDVKEILGHANIMTTQRYAHLSRQRLKEAVSQADEHYLSGQSLNGSVNIKLTE